MPINIGRKGVGAILANPAMRARFGRSSNRGGSFVVPPGTLAWRSPPFSTSALWMTGVTRDSAGAVLGSCAVDLFRTESDTKVAATVSDPTTGVYTFQILVGGPFYIVAYKAGSPDVMGTTVNTLVGA